MTEALQKYINKTMSMLSMYNGLLFGLVAIWAVSFIFTFIGLLSFSPLAMIASLAVLVLSVGLSSWLIGLLFGVRAHGPSSLITGLILALIFTPTIEPGGLLVLLLVGIIAGASKYILVIKGRHIFNPAAIAAVAIGFTGLGAASWWVATPPLTVFVLAVVAISLYKTKNYAIVLTFLAVAVPLLLIYLSLNGVLLAESLMLLLSWPLLFFAGIMLTEPLTLPPRKWQMYTEAVLVAILFAIPIKIGEFETNPAMALVIGNIFVALVAGRHAVALTFKERRKLTATTDEYVFTPNAPVRFKPGQFMELNVPQKKQDLRGERRSFSVTSMPGAKEVTFGIKFYSPSSTFKQTLQAAKPGTVVHVSNISGDFVLPKLVSKKVLMIAGGIGITPFISQLRANNVARNARDITLIYAVTSPDEIAYKDELVASGVPVIIVSPTAPNSLPKNWKHYQSSRVTKELLGKAVADITSRYAYVSGPPLFVQATKSSLYTIGARKVTTDYFAGY